jgi:DNA-binding Xre family transcriptional regulator
MSIRWRLRTYLSKKHQIFTATELQKLIIDKTKVKISIANICTLLRKKPISIKLKTMEIICTALECSLSDFCNVTRGKFNFSQIKRLAPHNTPKKFKFSQDFPNPIDYE